MKPLRDMSDSQMTDLFKERAADPGFAVAYALMKLASAQEETWRALRALGNADASTPMGAMEALGAAMIDGAEKIADAISAVAP